MTAPLRDRIATAGALVGSTAIALGSVLAAIAYTGRQGEAFTPLNHWVSELGEEGVSALAPVFNLGLILGGICFVVFMAGLAASVPGWLRFAFGAVGVAAGISGALVGLFPMNHLAEHRQVAATFFNLGWIAVAIASLDLVRRRDPRFPWPLAAVGALTVAAFIAFLAVVRVDGRLGGSTYAIDVRPDVWLSPILEWAVIAGILAWTFLAGLTWRRELRRSARGGPADAGDGTDAGRGGPG